MGTERQVMQDYLDTLVKRADFPAYFTDDVVATFEGTDQRADGRAAAGQLIRHVHQDAFDARMELKNLLTDAARPRSRRISPVPIPASSLGSRPPAGQVRVPYSVVYDLSGGQISALRIYFPMSQLTDQLSS